MNKSELIQRCNELALLGAGFVSPNPLVGAVLASKDGEIISEGYHKQYGDIHAEIDCINNARAQSIDLQQVTLAVNLEPCTHFGKQPPCIDTIIEAKIPHVVIGMTDPNPIISGSGIEKLRNAGVNVEVSVLENDCKWINRFFCHYITTGMPYITLKIAQTLDGYIATKDRHSKYISCDESRRRVHFMRAEMDAILIGINTVVVDNPILDCRLIDDANPIKNANNKIIVLDSNLQTPSNSKIFNKLQSNKTVFIIYSDEIDLGAPEVKEKVDRLESAGAHLLASPMKNGKIHLRKILSRLCLEFNITSILVEGGSEVFSSFANSNLIKELHCFISPAIMGNGKKAFDSISTNSLDEMKKFRIAGSFPSGIDEQIILLNNN